MQFWGEITYWDNASLIWRKKIKMCRIFWDLKDKSEEFFYKVSADFTYSKFLSGCQGDFLVNDKQDPQSKVNKFFELCFPKMFR